MHESMAKRILVIVALGIAIVGLEPARSSWPPYNIRVIDEETGWGIPNVRVTADSGVSYQTLPNGNLLIWGPASILNRTVRFQFDAENSQFEPLTARLSVRCGGLATVTMHRRS